MEHVSCLVCHSDKRSQLLPWRPLHHVVCHRCGFVYQTPRPTVEEMTAHYQRDYVVQFAPPEAEARAGVSERTGALTEWLTPVVSKASMVLEVGAGEGNMIGAIREHFGCSIQAVETSAMTGATAQARLGCPVHVTQWADAPVADASIDVVVMSHVLEHFHDPRAALAKAHRVLRPDGHLWVEVPNILNPSRTKRLSNWLSYEHLTYFSLARLTDMLSAEGFEVVRAETTGNVRVLTRRVQVPAQREQGWRGASELLTVLSALARHQVVYWPTYTVKRLAGLVRSRLGR